VHGRQKAHRALCATSSRSGHRLSRGLTTANLPGDVYLVFHERLVRAWRETGDEAKPK
jgi:hypothetical protein